ncbi:hypothetical protein BDF22DRAFT_678621 [Syncephalis plumigaleata]|nr:hypothetical protein BDF22DRAFT_678621 [Syncephalis plumigaleata]
MDREFYRLQLDGSRPAPIMRTHTASSLSRRPSLDSMQTVARCVQTLTKKNHSILALAATQRYIFSGTQGGRINVWDMHTYLLHKVLRGHHGAIFCLTLSADHTTLFSASECLYIVHALPGVGDILALAYSDKTGFLYFGCQNTSIQWFDTKNRDKLAESYEARTPLDDISGAGRFFRQGPIQPTSFTVVSDTSSNASVPPSEISESEESMSDDPPVRRYYVRENDVIASSHYGYIYSLLLADLSYMGGQVLLSGAGDGDVKIWSAKDGPLEHVRTLHCGKGNVLALAVKKDELLFCGCQGGEIKVNLGFGTFQHIRSLLAHEDDVMALTISYDSLFSGSADGVIKRWNRNFDCIQTAIGHEGIVLALTFAGPYLISGAGDNNVKFWDVGQPSVPAQLSEQVPTDMMLFALEQLVAIPSDCRHAANFLKSVMRQLGADAKLVYSNEGKNPLVIGRFSKNSRDVQSSNEPSSSRKLNVLIYGHYDVVPADESKWRFPPFQVTGENGYLYGRGVTDDKGPMLACIFAASELQDEKSLEVDVSFLIEGEEENGSAGFPEMVEEHKVCVNSYWLGETRPCLTYGLRGLVHATIKISSPLDDVHSGVDGGAASEPLMLLVQILAQLTGPDRSLNIPSFRNGIRSVSTKEDEYYNEIAANVAEEEGGDEKQVEKIKAQLMSRWRYPTFTIHRVDVSGPRDATVISRSATAAVSLPYTRDLFVKLNTDCEIKITIRKTADWWLADPENDYFQMLQEAIEKEWGQKPLLIREGGTIPAVRWLERCFDKVAVNLPMGQASDSAHLSNERIRLHNLLTGKRVVKHFLTQLGAKSSQSI